jgi:two-component system, response regulator
MPTPSLPPILVADDEAADVYLLRRSLVSAGVTNPIIGVADGEELLEFLTGATFGGLVPAVLFLDIRMPRMGGFEALAAIRSHPSLSRLKVVMLTGSDLHADIDRARALGADAYLMKFPEPARLAALLRELGALSDAA